MKPGARICIVTAGHLATCPRMVKAADALAEAGYNVRVVSSQYVDWATHGDADVMARRAGRWTWTPIAWGRSHSLLLYVLTGLRYRAARKLAALIGVGKLPFPALARAHSRPFAEIVAGVLAEPADLLYGGGGALAATASAARIAGVPYALDLEDFHSAEQAPSANSALSHALIARIEEHVLREAQFLTAASCAIAAQYATKYLVSPITINNVMALASEPPSLRASRDEGLQLYWFSQTIGPGRGLEDAVRAMGLAAIPGVLTLRGRPAGSYVAELKALARDVAPRIQIVHEEPAPPDLMIALAQGMDIGLAIEPGFSLNNRLALSNKAFTYMNAGLAIVFSDTPGQRQLALSLGEGAFLYSTGDTSALAAQFVRWSRDKRTLEAAKTAVWQAATDRWHWEHPSERGALLDAVANVGNSCSVRHRVVTE